MLFSILFDLLLIFLPVVIIIKRKNLRIAGIGDLLPAFRELGIFSIKPKKLLLQTALLAALLLAISFALTNAFYLLKFYDLEKVAETVVNLRQVSPILFFYILIFRPAAEEIFFRGFLVKRIGAFLSTVLFAAMHTLYFSIAEIIGAFVLGYVLALAFQKNKNLLPNISAHIIYNLTVIAVMLA